MEGQVKARDAGASNRLIRPESVFTSDRGIFTEWSYLLMNETLAIT